MLGVLPILAALLIGAIGPMPAAASDIAESTIEFHISTNLPVICVKDNKLDCIAGKLVERACDLSGLRYIFTDRPWKRAEEEISAKKGNTFFLVTGNAESNRSIDWFFPIYSDDVWLYSITPFDIQAPSRPGIVGVRRGSPFDQIPGPYGSFALYALNDWQSGVMMLKNHRLDAILATRLVIQANIDQSPLMRGEQGHHQVLGRMSWYIVRDADTPSSDVSERFKQGLERAKAENWFADMLASYGPSPTL